MKLYQAVFLSTSRRVIVGPDREIVVAHPAELHGLAFQRLDEQVVDLIEDAKRRHRSEPLAGLAEQAHGERVHGVAGIHRDRDPGAAMHRGDATPPVAAVFDVVVHEKCVVQHFQAGGGRKRILARGRPARARSRCTGRAEDPCPTGR